MLEEYHALEKLVKLAVAHTQELVWKEVSKRSSEAQMQQFQFKVTFFSNAFFVKFPVSSNTFDIQKLESFQTWANELNSADNRDINILMIVSSLLQGDHVGLSLYDYIHRKNHHEDRLDEEKIEQDAHLLALERNIGGGVGADAKFQAMYWLTTPEASQILCQKPYHTYETNLLLPRNCDVFFNEQTHYEL